MYTYIPSLWSLPPSRCPARSSAPSWAPGATQQLSTVSFPHGSVCMSMLLSRFIPPAPFPQWYGYLSTITLSVLARRKIGGILPFALVKSRGRPRGMWGYWHPSGFIVLLPHAVFLGRSILLLKICKWIQFIVCDEAGVDSECLFRVTAGQWPDAVAVKGHYWLPHFAHG